MRHREHGVGPAAESPVEEAFGVLGMPLRITPAVHVEDETRSAVGVAPVVAEGEAQMGLPDPGGAVDHGQGAGEEPPTQHRV